MDIDFRGNKRGSCNVEGCDCEQFERQDSSVKCEYCGDPPTRHNKLQSVAMQRKGGKKPTVIDVDCRGKRRGHCKMKECDCEQFQQHDTSKACVYCCDPPAKHAQIQLELKLQKVKTLLEDEEPKLAAKEADIVSGSKRIVVARKKKKKQKETQSQKNIPPKNEVNAELTVKEKINQQNTVKTEEWVDDNNGGGDECDANDGDEWSNNYDDNIIEKDVSLDIKSVFCDRKEEKIDPTYTPSLDEDPLFFSCTFCESRFKTKKSLKTHIRCHDGKETDKIRKLYTCDLCGNMYRQRKSLKIHKRVHLGIRNYKCEICGKEFYCRSSQVRHMKTHDPKSLNHKCEGCGASFHKAKELTEHIKQTGETPFECVICGAHFGLKTSFKAHLLVHEEKKYKCELCPREFRVRSVLKYHMRIHSGEMNYTCEYCGKRFLNKGYLKYHVMSHEGIRPYKCNDCEKRFVCFKYLQKHMQYHTNNKPFECSICQKSFKFTTVLKQHMFLHTGQKPYECNKCDARFATKGSLQAHSIIHTGEKRKYIYKFNCEECGKMFTSTTSLKLHKLKHAGEKPFQCEICTKFFGSPANLRSHVDIVHKKIKMHKCHTCDKVFGYSGHLARHLRTHTGEKPFTCSFCGMKFAGQSGIRRHVKMHTGEKPHICEFCGKGWAEAGDLRSHRRMHTGERPFVCDICGKTCTRRDNLRTHKKIHFKDGQQQPNIKTKQGDPLKSYSNVYIGSEANSFSEMESNSMATPSTMGDSNSFPYVDARNVTGISDPLNNDDKAQDTEPSFMMNSETSGTNTTVDLARNLIVPNMRTNTLPNNVAYGPHFAQSFHNRLLNLTNCSVVPVNIHPSLPVNLVLPPREERNDS